MGFVKRNYVQLIVMICFLFVGNASGEFLEINKSKINITCIPYFECFNPLVEQIYYFNYNRNPKSFETNFENSNVKSIRFWIHNDILKRYTLDTNKPKIIYFCDTLTNRETDSLFIEEVQNSYSTDKVLHAEPLFIDLIRDLGARKGEREWNFGMGINDHIESDNNSYLVEYEFAPIDRLGVEFELPITLYNSKNKGLFDWNKSKVNSFKSALQYTFYVSEKNKTSAAIGYMHEFEFNNFSEVRQTNWFHGNAYKPFVVVAKRFGINFHTLYYGGVDIFSVSNQAEKLSIVQQNNLSFHYLIPGTRNFIGCEFNQSFSSGDIDITIRPQLRLSVTDNLLIGIVTGIPLVRESERLSSFFRIIYEPKHSHR